MSQSLEITGILSVIGDTISVGTKGFTKREFVVTIPDGKFPQEVQFEMHKERSDILDKFQVGDEVGVTFDLRGREYNGRHYVNLNAWKITSLGGQGGRTAATAERPRHSAEGTYTRPDPLSKQGLAETSLNPESEDFIPF